MLALWGLSATLLVFVAISPVAAWHEDDCLEYFEQYNRYSDLTRVPLYTREAGNKRHTLGRSMHVEAAQHVYAQPLSIPEVVLERSVSNTGDTARLRNFFHKLRTGQPVIVGVMGGSITCGGTTRALEEQWSHRVFQWINATFPHPEHTYINACKPATPSMVSGACLTLPDNVDLVLLEFTVNDDGWYQSGGITEFPMMENEFRRGFERLLRKLAKLPQWPALLYLHVWQPDFMGDVFWKGGEMQVETILQYYGVPTVSARNALWHLSVQNAPGFTQNETNCGVHPNPLGHRYYADLVIGTLQDHAYGAISQAGEHEELPPLFVGMREVPPPMLKDNYEMDSECLTGELLHAAVVPGESKGWEWVDEGKNKDHPKLGFRTLEPDTSIVLQVNSVSGHAASDKEEILMGLGYLASYQHMGSFSVECVSGCVCEGVHNHTATHRWPSSFYKMVTNKRTPFTVLRLGEVLSVQVFWAATQHEACQLKISSLPYTASGEHKVKFDTLMVATGVSSKWVEQMNYMHDETSR